MLLLNQTTALRATIIQGPHQPKAPHHFSTNVLEHSASIRLVSLKLPPKRFTVRQIKRALAFLHIVSEIALVFYPLIADVL